MLALNCKEVTTLLAMSHLEDQSRGRRLQVRFHLLICYFCRKYERQIAHIASAFRLLVQKAEGSAPIDPLKLKLIDHLSRH